MRKVKDAIFWSLTFLIILYIIAEAMCAHRGDIGSEIVFATIAIWMMIVDAMFYMLSMIKDMC